MDPRSAPEVKNLKHRRSIALHGERRGDETGTHASGALRRIGSCMIGMMPMELVVYPSNHLVAKNQKIDAWTPDIAARVAEMRKVMEKSDGIGIAAPQVGWNVQLFILGIPAPNDGEVVTRVVWNPEVETSGDLVPMPEGCLSFPGIRASVPRWTRARLRGRTPEGLLDEVFVGVAAQAVQHEMDHIEGLLFIEKMTPADRMRVAPILRELAEKSFPQKKH